MDAVPFAVNLIDALHPDQRLPATRRPQHAHGERDRLRLDDGRRLHDHAERVAAAAAERPEQVAVQALVRRAVHAVGRDDLELHDAVHAEAVHGRQDRVPAAREPAAGRADGLVVPADRGDVERVRPVVDGSALWSVIACCR
jgi:hypothetical protein